MTIDYLDVPLGTTRLNRNSMTCRPADYEQFCRDKIVALTGYLHRCLHASLAESLRRRGTAGIYLWAAKSILRMAPEERSMPRICSLIEPAWLPRTILGFMFFFEAVLLIRGLWICLGRCSDRDWNARRRIMAIPPVGRVARPLDHNDGQSVRCYTGTTYRDLKTEKRRLPGAPCHDDARTQRLPDADRPRHADGRAVPALLDSGADVVRAAGAGLPAGAREAPVGAADRVPRFARAASD